MLSNHDLHELTDFRRALHRVPEISGEEEKTAATIVSALQTLKPDEIITGLGGHGVAAVFDSGIEGDTVLFRAELDALPIHETTSLDWTSEVEGKGHLCGHDGHMTMLLGLGRLLAREPVSKGRVVLMFQPAEEDGSGARLVAQEKRYQNFNPDWAFAIHNEPGLPFGVVATRTGLMNCASRGMKITLTGKTAHAAEPELAHSPLRAMNEITQFVQTMAEGDERDDDFKLVTVTHMNMGEPSFGITPGLGVIYLTLRTADDAILAELVEMIEGKLSLLCDEDMLSFEIEFHDDFAASINHADAVAVAREAMDTIGVQHSEEHLPMRASEDFGVFGHSAKAAMLCLGPGPESPALHHPDYDFNDDLIPIGANIFERIARDLLG